MTNIKKPSPMESRFLDDDPSEGHREPQDLQFGAGHLEAIQTTCEAIGQIMETWGFKKILGMLWAFLYLCPEPASAKDICTHLKISPASVSITLQDLQRWQVVKKISPVGNRRDYYVAEHDTWKMIRKVLREREKSQMENVQTKLDTALQALNKELATKADLKSKRTSQFQKIRLEDLQAVTGVALGLLEGFIGEGQLDVSPIFSLLKPYNQLAIETKRTRS